MFTTKLITVIGPNAITINNALTANLGQFKISTKWGIKRSNDNHFSDLKKLKN